MGKTWNPRTPHTVSGNVKQGSCYRKQCSSSSENKTVWLGFLSLSCARLEWSVRTFPHPVTGSHTSPFRAHRPAPRPWTTQSLRACFCRYWSHSRGSGTPRCYFYCCPACTSLAARRVEHLSAEQGKQSWKRPRGRLLSPGAVSPGADLHCLSLGQHGSLTVAAVNRYYQHQLHPPHPVQIAQWAVFLEPACDLPWDLMSQSLKGIFPSDI